MRNAIGTPHAGLTDPIPDIDLADVPSTAAPDPDAVLTGLQAEHPVFWHGPKSRPGFWAVIGHAETLRVYRDSAGFSAAHGMTLDTLRAELDPASGMMVEVTDPPEHRRLRRSIGVLFSDGAVADLAPVVAGYVASLLAEVRGREEPVEFVHDVAARIPTFAAGALLGLPAADLPWITERTALVFLSDPGHRSGRRRADAEEATGELLAYFAKMLRTDSSSSGGLVGRLAVGTATRDGLSTGEAILNALNLVIGGTTTTRSALTNLVHTLATEPAVLADLRADPAAVPLAVEEAVRHGNPVRHLTRVATADVELGGQTIRAGDPVAVWPRSANRDAAVFARPHLFDIRRHPNPHIGFAAGTHGCPGTGLARAQLRATLQCLSETVSEVSLAGPAELMPSNFLRGYGRMPLRLTSAA